MSTPLVSILLPAFDNAATLAATLATVVAQDWPAWELLIVDDASQDETLVLAQAFAALHARRVQVLAHAENAGAGIARNTALAASSGVYVASLDADDLWDSSKLRCQVAALEASPAAAMVWGPGWYADSAGAATRLQAVPLPPTTALLPVPALVALMLDGVAPFTSSVMMRREAAVAVGGYEPLRRGQDMSLLFKLAAAWPTLYDPEPRCRYRLHEGSSTRWCERQLLSAQRDDLYYRWVAGYLGCVPAVAHLAPRAQLRVEQQRRFVVAEQLVAALTPDEAAALSLWLAQGADLRATPCYAKLQELCGEGDGAQLPADMAAALLSSLAASAAPETV